MKTVLVSGASGIVGYGTLKSLKNFEKSLRLIGTTIYEDSVAQGFCDIFEKAPLTNDENYI
jgi:carbamoyl-phosphate synthase large subunit